MYWDYPGLFERHDEAREQLVNMIPTTLAGVIARLRHLLVTQPPPDDDDVGLGARMLDEDEHVLLLASTVLALCPALPSDVRAALEKAAQPRYREESFEDRLKRESAVIKERLMPVLVGDDASAAAL